MQPEDGTASRVVCVVCARPCMVGERHRECRPCRL